MKRCMRLLGILAWLAMVPGAAQDSDKLPENPQVPTVRFECFWEAATPQDFVIIATNLARARYLSRNPTRPSQPDPTSRNPVLPDYQVEFSLSPASQTKIFKLASQANYFNGDFDYKKHPMANTGNKTLTYADQSRHFETAYNWSENTAIGQLTELFQSISNTVEHGRRLEYLRRYDRLGLEDELKAMEDQAQSHQLAELQVIRPVLESIAGDSGVLNIARQRARRLLDSANKQMSEHADVKMP